MKNTKITEKPAAKTAAKKTPAKAAKAEEKVVKAEKSVKAAEEKLVQDVKTVEKKAVKATGEAKAEAAAKVEKAVKNITESVKTTAKATVKATTKAATKKAAAKKAAVKETVYLQYLGKEIDKDEILKQVKEIWTKQLKNKVGDMKSVTLYLKPEENAAYYVINGDITGKVDL